MIESRDPKRRLRLKRLGVPDLGRGGGIERAGISLFLGAEIEARVSDLGMDLDAGKAGKKKRVCLA